ncbi:MAG: hypothetical protein DRJ03_01870 [Chloroflexi bacterium]|nr:MAG: hypothetical protein DRJ03_01870 [Chloroflexota bacterium]
MKNEPRTFAEIGTAIGKLVTEKNEAYGDSFRNSGEIIRLLYPNGVMPGQYRDMLATVRVIDKLNRIAQDKGAFDENPRRDIAGYAVLAVHADVHDDT